MSATDGPPYRDASLPLEERVANLLSQLTLSEKIDQLHQCGVGDANPNNLAARADEFRPTYGSFILNGAEASLVLRNELQRRCVEESRLGIPAIFGCDVIHGFRTIFPIPLAQACAWDAELVRRLCASAAEMARAHGVDWTFAPMVDHCVDPRWGRVAETFGESVHATSMFAAAAVRGYQGERPGAPDSIAACLKHFVGYGASEGGRDYSFTSIPSQQLWENHLPPFEAGVRAGALSVMSAFNDLNGVPASANRALLTDVLRTRWSFAGLVVSDWNAVFQLIRQGFAADEADAARLALEAGVDLNMADGLFRTHLPRLLREGTVSAARLDEAVARVLRMKFALGLFEQPFVQPTPLTSSCPTTAQLALAHEAAVRSAVLLKNEHAALPLPATVRSVALIGPLANDAGALLGSWAQHGRGEETETIAAALRSRLPGTTQLSVAPGCAIDGDDRSGFAAAIATAKAAEAVILCLGETAAMSGENASRASLRFPGLQQELALAVADAAQGKPLSLVIVSGRPLELHTIEPAMHAVLAAWQLGSAAGAAIADLLTGRATPSGRLAITWPRTTGQIPVYHHERSRARGGREGLYQDLDTAPHFEFGHGLSYTSFRYSRLRTNAESVRPGANLIVELDVENVGARPGAATVLWFVRDLVASITRPRRELKHFESVALAAGERRVCRWEIVPERDLSFPDAEGRRKVEPGEFELLVEGLTHRFTVDQC